MRRFTAIPAAILFASTAFVGLATAAPLAERGEGAPAAAVPAKGPFVTPTQVAEPAQRRNLRDADGDGLSDDLAADLARGGPDGLVEVIVTLDGPGSAARAQALVGTFQVTAEFTLIDGFAATMRGAQARALAASPGVFRVEADAMAYASLAAARRDFGVETVRSDPATTGLTGAGVKLCVIDTGVLAEHEQFVEGGVSRVMDFLDLVGDINGVIQTAPYDDHGHGTHVIGTAAGDGTPLPVGGDTDLAGQLQGVAPGAEIYAVKALDANGTGPDSGIILGMEQCVAWGVDIINMSLGIPGNSDGQDAVSQAADAAARAGVVVVSSAGNAGDGNGTVGAPATADWAIAVGSAAEWSAAPSDPWFSAGLYPDPFSSRGPRLDGVIKPDIMAPGDSIAAAYIDPFGVFGCGNSCYTILSGTSMASPFVAGTVALMIEAARSDVPSRELSPAEVRQILANTAQDRGEGPGKDNLYGHGLLDAYAAVMTASGESGYAPTAFPDYERGTSSVAKSGSVQIPVTVTDSGTPLAVTLDIDGSVNRFGWKPDLDVLLLDEFGDPFLVPNPLYPWFSPDPMMPAPGTASTCPAGDLCGTIGQQETVYFSPPAAGNYLVEVYPWDGWPNNGAGGSFAYEISNGSSTMTPPPSSGPLAADAGSDQSVTDVDENGGEVVFFDGSHSTGAPDSYEWRHDGILFGTGMTAYKDLPVGTHSIELTVIGAGGSASDSLTVTVATAKGGGGGGNGNGRGGGKKSR